MTVHQPLSGLKILDFSTLLPGPMATLFLLEAGAEVLKIERPGGEEMRYYPPKWGDTSVNYAILNRNKTVLTLDLKQAEAFETLRPHIEKADILVEQFRPGVMDRLGFGYATLKALNPRLVYCSITGYGQTGPKSQKAGHDMNYIGDAGLLSVSHGTSETPTIPPGLIADIAGGSYPAVMNILLAIIQREKTGEGSHIDIAMADGAFPFTFWAYGAAQTYGHLPKPGKERLTGGSPRYQLYPTKDHRFVAAGPLEEKFWIAFCQAINLEKNFWNDSEDPNAVIQAVRNIIIKQTSAYWEPIFTRADCCCTIMKNLDEALNDPHFHHRGLFSKTLTNHVGESIKALPVPIALQFKAPNTEGTVPKLDKT